MTDDDDFYPEYPHCERCGTVVTDDMTAAFAPFCSLVCQNGDQKQPLFRTKNSWSLTPIGER